jgi:UDP-3-O-[3-hydroxymyristoyl] N-acetylglucosamine deacetylase
VALVPSESGRIAFARDGHELAADLDCVSSTARCTTLAAGGVEVSTVEHLLAALSALAVTSVTVEVEGPEVPILDGSAAPFTRALRCAVRRLPGERATLKLAAPVWLEHGASSFLAVPAADFRVVTAVDYPHPLIGRQVADVVVSPETFEHEIAPARTFGFEHELEELIARGLARGGSLDNALVFMNDGGATDRRFADEPARHKALDVIGDLALLGALPLAHVWAVRPSHRLNVEFARMLRDCNTGRTEPATRDAQHPEPVHPHEEGDST